MTCGDGVGRDGGDGVADAGGGLFEELRRVYLRWYALGEAAGEGGLRGGFFGCADDLKAFVEMHEPEPVDPVSVEDVCRLIERPAQLSGAVAHQTWEPDGPSRSWPTWYPFWSAPV